MDRIRSTTSSKKLAAPLVVKSILKQRPLNGKRDDFQLSHRRNNQESVEDRKKSIRWADYSQSKSDADMFQTKIYDIEDEECEQNPGKIWIRHTDLKTKELMVEGPSKNSQCLVDGTARKLKPKTVTEVKY